MLQLPDIGATLLAQRGRLVLWAPVMIGIGIAGYFSLPAEPRAGHWFAMAIFGILAVGLGRRIDYAVRPLAYALALVLLGAGVSGLRTDTVSDPVLTFRYYGPVTGRVIAVDRSASDAVRVTLDHVTLDRIAPDRTPARVRISLHGDQRWLSPEPGMIVGATAHLSPPSGPAEPGGFDFRLNAWFDRLGAIGYTRSPMVLLEPAQNGWALWVGRIRAALSGHVRQRIDGQTGAFAAAILTGDRSAISTDTTSALRATNLAHLLAISGLHMGLLTGTVFAAVRGALALWPWGAVRLSGKKVAAAVALASGGAYLVLSGGNVATVRAFIMVGTMFVAILLDRRALTLRSVAISAMIILVLWPEELLGPGFQMSFAATVGLVWVFGSVGRLESRAHPLLKGAVSVVLSSLVAGLATAPVSAAHFGTLSHYGLIANILSVPVMGALVMPSALAAVVLAPLGLDWIGFIGVELGLSWILSVAEAVAGLSGALSFVPAAPTIALGLMAVSALFVVIWQGRLRHAGWLGVVGAFWVWSASDRPILLVSQSGGQAGLLTDVGRAIARDRGDGFAVSQWLESDGERSEQSDAAARAGWTSRGRVVTAELGEITVLLAAGSRALSEVDGCGGADLLITNQDAGPRPCEVYDEARLRDTGSLAIDGSGHVVTAAQIAGRRPWTGRP